MKHWRKKIKELDYALQPIVALKNGKTYAVEALVRKYEKAGFESIDSLFDYALQINDAIHFDFFLRKLAIRKFQEMPNADKIRLFFNYDPRILKDQRFKHRKTSDYLQRFGLATNQVCFELSEKYKYSFSKWAKDYLEITRIHGFSIALDDFGTGFSGLELLYYSSPDFIKFDRFLIKDIYNDNRKQKICLHLLGLCQSLGIQSIAEGIETREELLCCYSLGFNFGQGFLIQRPTLNVNDISVEYPHIIELISQFK